MTRFQTLVQNQAVYNAETEPWFLRDSIIFPRGSEDYRSSTKLEEQKNCSEPRRVSNSPGKGTQRSKTSTFGDGAAEA